LKELLIYIHMKLFTKFNQRGHIHLIAPIIAIVAVMFIGGFVALKVSHAAANDCSVTSPTITPGKSSACVQNAQQMVNGVLAYMYLNSIATSNTNNAPNINAATTAIDKWPLAKLDSASDFDVNNGFGKLYSSYGSTDQGWVKKIQANITNVKTSYGRGFSGVKLTPRGSFSATGNIDVATWGMLCAATNKIYASGQSSVHTGTDYEGGNSSKGKLAMWFIRSYMRAGISASSNAQCASILNPPTSAAPTIKDLTYTASTTTVTVTWLTDQSSNSAVVYNLPGTAAVTVKSSDMETAHSIAIKNLKSGTTYAYHVSSTNIANKTAVSATSYFTTASTTGTGGGGGGGTPPPTTGTNATVNFDQNLGVPALNDYSIGDTISTYGASDGSTISTNATYRNTLAALGPLAWRVPERLTGAVPTGAGTGGGGTGYVQAIRQMNGVPVVIAAGQTGDDNFNDTQIQALAKYYNANGGQNGGPVTHWIVGNEPEGAGGFGAYATNVPGVVNAIDAGSTGVSGLAISAGTVWDQGDISLLSQIAGDKGVTYLSWHAYQGGDGNGSNSGQYSGPIYESEEQQAQKIATSGGKQSGIEEFNWNSGCGNGGAVDTYQNELFIASVIGNILAGGGSHAYMYSDTNGSDGCDTLSSAANGQRPAYWALGMWTGMNKEFDRFGSNLVDTKVANVDVTDPTGKENTNSLAHQVELFATNNGKILAINENNAGEPMTIGIGGYKSGTYTVWQSGSGNVNATDEGTTGAPKELLVNPSNVNSGHTFTFSGSKLSITLPAGSISSIDVSGS
jgi:hypothetical protein